MSTNDPAFIHLRAHSEYSIVDGLLRIDQWIAKTVELEMPAVAITDRCNLFGLVKFYRKAMAKGIKPIIGAEVIIRQDDELSRVVLLCKNKIGYHHLTHLISESYLKGQEQDGTPVIAWEWLVQAHEGLIVLSAAEDGDIGMAILSGQIALAKKHLKRWLGVFNQHFYIELQRTQRPQQTLYLQVALELAEQFQVPVVATNDVRFLEREDFEAHEARVCIHSGYVLEDPKRPKSYTEQQYFRSPEDMQQLFSDIPEALTNSVAIAKRCNLELTFGQAYLPEFPVPKGVTLANYIKEQAVEGLIQRLADRDVDSKTQSIYTERLLNELSVINRMGFPGYFLIVADFISWAKRQNIPVGPGRGSGAGSLVAYTLGITELDPIQHKLLFERFLNPERVSMPDFDIDFCMEGRDRVIDYVAERYGRNQVAQIITYGTMAARAVVRDVGRVLGMPYGHVDKIAKLIPFELGMTLKKALEQEPQLSELYKKEQDIATLIDLARKLEGITRNVGKHAGGVVIAPTQLIDFTPLYCEPDGNHIVTQFDKDDVEAVGLVKFDFLGLRTLTIIEWAVVVINQKRAQCNEALLDIGKIPLDDKKTFQLLQSCATAAVFQLESRGMRDLIRRLRPDCFDDITALVALFRPGPLQSGMVDDFMVRKHGQAAVFYAHPDLEPILRPTYGVILYQEQVMKIAQVLAGYSLGGADILRRAMGKKKPEEMAKQREVFVSGAQKRGIEQQTAEHIFDLMEKFAGYGFNKSHSAAYALIAYQTAWLKAHYPAQFMAAVLSSDMDNTDKIVGFLAECELLKLTVLPPDVNVGHYQFSVNERGEIEYGLGAIKGAGEAAVHHISAEREDNGPFKDLFEFCQRLDLRKVSRRVIEPLISAGAMDAFGDHRAGITASINAAIKAAEQLSRNQQAGQGDLFSDIETIAPAQLHQQTTTVVPWAHRELLQREKSALGFYLSGHPLQMYEQELAQFITAPLAELKLAQGKNATIAGVLVAVRPLNTKSGKRMAVITLEDRSGRIEVTLFSRLYSNLSGLLVKDQVYVVKGKVEKDDFTNGVRMVAESLQTLEQTRADLAKRLVIQVQNQDQVNELLHELTSLIETHRGGKCPVAIAYQAEAAHCELALGRSWFIKPKDDLIAELQQCCGEERVMVEY